MTDTVKTTVKVLGAEDAEQPKEEEQLSSLQKAAAERKEVNLRKKKRGRPKKAAVAAKTKGKRGQVGRPKGDAGIMNEYKARMLASPKSKRVLDTILDAALDNDHKNQAAAWKLVMDRILPSSLFEKDVSNGSKPSINITISNVGGTVDVAGSEQEQYSDNDDNIIEGDFNE